MKALLVIDMQSGVYEDAGQAAFAGERVIAVVNDLVARARSAGCPVVFVQHEDDDALAHGSDAWDLVSGLDARSDDTFSGKRHGSAFHDTHLGEQLRSDGIDQLVVCGMQTEFCVDSTCRHAFALGFEVELVLDAHTTFDSLSLSAAQIIAHHNRVLASYASVLPAESVVFTSSDGQST